MGIALIEAQLQQLLAATITNWPIRWPNENWPATMMLSPDNSPLDASGAPVPFIEAETIMGADTASIAPPGNRYSERIGLFRIYLIAPQGTGRGGVNAQADTICAAFKRDTVFFSPTTGERLTLMDPRVDDNVAEHSQQTDVRIDSSVPLPFKGARYVRMISIPFWYEYYS